MADLDRPETLSAALEDADSVFLYARPDGIDGFVAAAESAGVKRVVLLSSGAVLDEDPDSNPIGRMHVIVESAIERSNLEWTFIRPGMFATNALWWWQRSIREEGTVRMPYPEARTAPVHEQDLAALAVTALIEPGHHGHAYAVTGPESLTLRQQVRHIGVAIDRDIAVESISVEEARTELGRTLPPPAVDAIMAGWEAGTMAVAEPTPITRVVAGHRARTFARWAADHVDDFR